MEYEFLNSSIDREHIILPNSDKINSYLLKNNEAEIIKAIDFIASDEKLLHVHGFMGTGKRQFIDYVSEFISPETILLEYYCKASTVCDDILLDFNDKVEKHSISKAVNINAKITTLAVKFQQQISSIKKPFLIVLHSLDDILPENIKLISDILNTAMKEENIKVILSTRAMQPEVMNNLEDNRKIFLKAFTKEIFNEFVFANFKNVSEKSLEDFYNETRGYYYYVALSIKIIQAMQIDVAEFLRKYRESGMSFDSYIGVTYVNLIPTTIRNFFWFLRVVRHGLSLNALAVFEIYDEFSIEYLKSNLMIFQVGETLYVQDYFLQKIDIMIPEKTEIRLHKYIIGIYEKQLKETLKERVLNISRQAMRAEIEYHNACIENIKNVSKPKENNNETRIVPTQAITEAILEETISDKINNALKLAENKNYTDAIEKLKKILDIDGIDLSTVVDVRLNLAKLYKEIADYYKSSHYFELVETYYIQHNELINLNYLYYDMTDLYFKMYKNERAIQTIKKVIYSVDTPQSLMVSACTLLGNIYSEINDPIQAYNYYKKALESLDENVSNEVLSDLYFKYALANDDRGNTDLAFEYYNKCIAVGSENFYKASAYANLASCYMENENYEEAKVCFKKSYEIEKGNNNYEGVYYTSSHLAQIYEKENSSKALDLLIEAKKSAEFINEDQYILEASIALGNYYYNNPKSYKEALIEYFKSKTLAGIIGNEGYSRDIERRIEDMRIRMTEEDFSEIEKKYEK